MRLADKEMYSNKAKLKDTNERRIAAHREATIRVMHEALGSGMWGMEFDESGKMISVKWSPEFRKMIGYKDENDFPNEFGSWADLLHPEDRDAVLKEYNDTIADYSGQKNYDVEYRLKVKSGEYRWFHAIGRLLRRDNGVPLSYVGMFVDITDKKNGEIYAGSDL
jgi:PAS domain S-box-containing protein